MSELHFIQLKETLNKAKELLADAEVNYDEFLTEGEAQSIIDEYNGEIAEADMSLEDAMEKIDDLMELGYAHD